jgi:hypothetical protein
VVAAVKPLLPLPMPLTPIRSPPLSVKVPAGLLASGPVTAGFWATIVFWRLKVEPAAPAQKVPPPLVAKLPLTVSLRRFRLPVKLAGASMPPPLAPALFRALLRVMVELVMVEPMAAVPVVWSSMAPPPPTAVLPAKVLAVTVSVVPLAKRPPPVPPLELSLISVLMIVVLGPPS